MVFPHKILSTRVTVFRFCHTYATQTCGICAFHPCYRQNQVPPAGVSPLKTQRKVLWATVGHKRRNVVSLIIDNNCSFLAGLRPLIFHTFSTKDFFKIICRFKLFGVIHNPETGSAPFRVDMPRKTLSSMELFKNRVEPSAKSEPNRPPVCSE